MKQLRARFPPIYAADIIAYDLHSMFQGYADFAPHSAPPDATSSPSYRWGWQNALRDYTGEDDGLDHMRIDFLRLKRRPQ